MLDIKEEKGRLAAAALARIGQGYSPSRRLSTVRQNWSGVLDVVSPPKFRLVISPNTFMSRLHISNASAKLNFKTAEI